MIFHWNIKQTLFYSVRLLLFLLFCKFYEHGIFYNASSNMNNDNNRYACGTTFITIEILKLRTELFLQLLSPLMTCQSFRITIVQTLNNHTSIKRILNTNTNTKSV